MLDFLQTSPRFLVSFLTSQTPSASSLLFYGSQGGDEREEKLLWLPSVQEPLRKLEALGPPRGRMDCRNDQQKGH
ncbi:hypothetical protein Hypma_004851 [Hypsizygus marmoreus]|uniref:Uncharacterized protein n=1 Tax=Hypsizygus marmoreus TaxID=39966 RepID=A0A369J645_HYPMA|nr:hypothetical protein Hypma_004851 [Hypsizygus marmoreus]